MRAKDIYRAIVEGRMSEEEFENIFAGYSIIKLKNLTIDGHREVRTGIPEVIYGKGKSWEDLASLVRESVDRFGRAFVTKVGDLGEKLEKEFPDGFYNRVSSTFRVGEGKKIEGVYTAIVSAGASDRSVLEEVEETLIFLGSDYKKFEDVGISGPHRIVEHIDELRRATSVIVVCGMEAALPSFVSSLVNRVVIGVPTDVGYGVSFGGLTPLFSMLSSCSPGVLVVNISNGFGAACAAHRINLLFS